MVKHIVAWQLKEGIDLPSVTAKMKEELEGLVGKVEGLNFAEVLIDKGMGSVVLISELDSNLCVIFPLESGLKNAKQTCVNAS